MKIADLISRDFMIYLDSVKLLEIKSNLDYQKVRYIIAINGGQVTGVYGSGCLAQKMPQLEENNCLLKDLRCGRDFSMIDQDSPVSELKGLTSDIAVVVDREAFPIGIISDLRLVRQLLDYADRINQETKETLCEYKSIFECLEEEIFVTDQSGYILRLNPAAERVCGVKSEEVVGKHVRDLEEENVFSASITMSVIRQKKKVNMMQNMKTGKRLLSTAVPVCDDKGEIIRVIATSKDLEEINKLREELEEKKTELERKDQEINLLREEIFTQVNFICKSKEMDFIKESIAKIAPVDLTVLIQGESGVGKEVVTKTLHHLSPRRDYPFVKINCSLIPENLLESELFGYEAGAFTGASKKGKIGKIELANNGTLFLDEIGEIPLNVQVKLLEFLQDREITHIGGNAKIRINTRVVAATNRDLKKMVKERHFRQDLFYRLNVVPIVIPPLRERKDDIPALVDHFLIKFNRKYNMNKQFAPEVMNAFINYNWPGNVRELEHVMERVIIINASDLITVEHLPDIFEVRPHYSGKVICTDLIPLKSAKKELEEQLLTRAYEIYKSTYKVAKVLEIDQSTVVKLLKKYK